MATLWVALTIVTVATLGSGPASAGVNAMFPIRALHSGKVMDVPGGQTGDGVAIVQWTQNGGTNQVWTPLVFSTVGDLPLVILRSEATGKVLDVEQSSTMSGANLVQNTWSAAVSQLWTVVQFGDTPYFLVININSGKVADVTGAQLGNGAAVIQWPWHGGTNQLWSLSNVAP